MGPHAAANIRLKGERLALASIRHAGNPETADDLQALADALERMPATWWTQLGEVECEARTPDQSIPAAIAHIRGMARARATADPFAGVA